jgi:hypothetical protein
MDLESLFLPIIEFHDKRFYGGEVKRGPDISPMIKLSFRNLGGEKKTKMYYIRKKNNLEATKCFFFFDVLLTLYHYVSL